MDDIRFGDVQLVKLANVYDNSCTTVVDRFSELEKDIERYKNETALEFDNLQKDISNFKLKCDTAQIGYNLKFEELEKRNMLFEKEFEIYKDDINSRLRTQFDNHQNYITSKIRVQDKYIDYKLNKQNKIIGLFFSINIIGLILAIIL